MAEPERVVNEKEASDTDSSENARTDAPQENHVKLPMGIKEKTHSNEEKAPVIKLKPINQERFNALERDFMDEEIANSRNVEELCDTTPIEQSRFDALERDFVDEEYDWDEDRIETARVNDLADHIGGMQVPVPVPVPVEQLIDYTPRDNLDVLAVDSLVTQNARIDFSVMRHYIAMKIAESAVIEVKGQKFYEFKLFYIPGNFDLKASIEQLESVLGEYHLHAVFAVYEVLNEWRVLVVRKDAIQHYKPIPPSRDESRWRIYQFIRDLRIGENIPGWPTCTDITDTGVLVMLLMEHHLIKYPVEWLQEQAEREVNEFRKRVLVELERNFKLTVGGRPYNAESYEGEAVPLVVYPEFNIDVVNEEEHIDSNFMTKYLEWLLRNKQGIAFVNVGRFPTNNGEEYIEQLFEMVQKRVEKIDIDTLYVTYLFEKQWRLFIVRKSPTRKLEHYDPFGETRRSNDLTPQAKRFVDHFKKWSEDFKTMESLNWPTQGRNVKNSGKLVILAIEYHRRPEVFTRNHSHLLKNFRDHIAEQLHKEFKVMMNGRRYRHPFTGQLLQAHVQDELVD